MTKLVELLAKSIEIWPETTKCYAQDSDKQAFPYLNTGLLFRSNHLLYWEATSSSGLDFAEDAKVIKLDKLAEDFNTTFVTKEMWEAARKNVAQMQEGGG